MIRNLLVFSGISLLASVVCIGGAVALAGGDLTKNGASWSMLEKDGNIRFHRNSTETPVELSSKTLTWSGGTKLDVAIPVDVTYVQGPANTVVISGPKALVDLVRIEGSSIELAKDAHIEHKVSFNWTDGHLDVQEQGLQITITAPNINDFSVSGVGDLILQNYDQPTLNIGVSGMGDVEAIGRTDTLTLSISGAGDADLESLVARDADISVSGKGDATVSPTETAKVNVSGVGDVNLTTKPRNVTSSITGMGELTYQ